MMQIQVNNIALNYLKQGSGSSLLLLHGNGEKHTIFKVLTEQLKTRFTVYAIDSRNHGESTKTDDYTYESMAEDISQFIQKLDLKDVSVLGFSDGAIVAAMIEMAHPHTFKKMALLGINLKPSDFKQESIDYLKEEYAKTKDPLFKMMLEEPNIELGSLTKIECPTLIIRAEDEIFKHELYEEIVTAMPDAKLLVAEGHDHGSYIIDNDILYDDLVKFF